MNQNQSKIKPFAVVDPESGNYEKHPLFVKKTIEANALVKDVGLPKKLTKAK